MKAPASGALGDTAAAPCEQRQGQGWRGAIEPSRGGSGGRARNATCIASVAAVSAVGA